MVLVSMAGEHSGFPGSALNSLLLFPCLAVLETVVFPFILNGKGHARFKKKIMQISSFEKCCLPCQKLSCTSEEKCHKER